MKKSPIYSHFPIQIMKVVAFYFCLLFTIVSTINAAPLKGKELIDTHVSMQKMQLSTLVEYSIKGIVTDEKGEKLPGVSISLKGTNRGIISNSNGEYSIIVPNEQSVLVFSFVGYKSQEIFVGNSSTLNVVLKIDNNELDEVVVVGYGVQVKRDLTGSVSSVKGADIQNQPSGGIQQSLQGRMAGVNIIRNGGAPGNAGSIRIRGIGTVNNSEPLILIDGVPASSMNDVNPNDIETVDVLKDASASAIYGTRAANGVIIVTTKRGKLNEKLRVSLNSYIGSTDQSKFIDVLDAPSLTKLKQEAYKNDGLDLPAIWSDKNYQTQKTNWQKEIYRTGVTKNLDISVTGGGANSSFVISASKYNEDGVIKKSYYDRSTFRINSDHKITSKLKITQNFQYTNTHDNAPNTLSAQDGLLWTAIRFHPGLPVFESDGSYSTNKGKGAFGDINNPIYTIDVDDKENNRNRFLSSVSGEYEIIKGLKLRANFAIDASFTNSRNFSVKIDDQFRSNSYNQLTLFNRKNWSNLQEYFVSYDKQIKSHSIGFVGGYTSQTFDSEFTGNAGRDFSNEEPSLRYMNYAGSVVSLGSDNGGKSYNALQSYFGRLNYSFKDKYLFTGTFRADGSSNFAPNNRWGYFPAFSAGWRIIEEPFFNSLANTFSDFKLTAGWGQLGNQNVSSLQYLALINSGYRYSFGDGETLGSAQGRLPNVNIGWEVAEMTNIGLDVAFMKNMFYSTINYFVKNTRNMLLAPPSLGTIGRASIPDQNVGQLKNSGLEVELGFQKKTTDLSININGNATFINNQIVELQLPGSFLGGPTYGRTDQEINRTYVGSSYGTFYGWKTNGLYQTKAEIDADKGLANDSRRSQGLIHPGDVKFLDLNNDGLIDDKDRTIIGNPQPKITFGLNTSLRYKSFDLSIFFLGVGGVDIYNADRMQGLDASYSFNMYSENMNRWTAQGTSNSIPRLSIDNPNKNFRTSDLFVEKGDFVRLKNLTLGYNLPKSILDKIKVSQIRVYATGQNLFTWTKYSGLNPELGFSVGQYPQQNVDYAQYPLSRTVTLGLSLTL